MTENEQNTGADTGSDNTPPADENKPPAAPPRKRRGALAPGPLGIPVPAPIVKPSEPKRR